MSERKDGGAARGVVRDRVFAMRDGWFCFVNGNEFGPWPDRGSAYAGMLTEQRRADALLSARVKP